MSAAAGGAAPAAAEAGAGDRRNEALSVADDIDDLALGFKQIAQLSRDGRMVLGDQHPEPHAMPRDTRYRVRASLQPVGVT